MLPSYFVDPHLWYLNKNPNHQRTMPEDNQIVILGTEKIALADIDSIARVMSSVNVQMNGDDVEPIVITFDSIDEAQHHYNRVFGMLVERDMSAAE